MEKTWALLSIILFLTHQCLAQEIKIGGLFDTEDETQEKAFKFAVDAINEEASFLPDHKLVAITKNIPFDDAYAASQEACNLIQEGVIAIFGPSSGKSSYHIESICESKDISHLEYRIDANQQVGKNRINFYPHPLSLAKAVVDLITRFDWKEFTILYENNESLVRLTNLFEIESNTKPFTIVLRQLDLGMGLDYRMILYTIKSKKERNFVIDCSTEVLEVLMVQAQQVGLVTDEQSYIITNLDMHTLDLTPFQYAGTNITGFRLFTPDDKDIIEAVDDYNEYYEKRRDEPTDDMEYSDAPMVPASNDQEKEALTSDTLSTEAALIMDTVYAYASVLNSELPHLNYTSNVVDCEDLQSWHHGSTVMNYIKTATIDGLSGLIKFDDGLRTDFTLYVVQLTRTGIQKIGEWNSTMLVLSGDSNIQQIPFEDGILMNRTFRILTAISKPYGLRKESSITLEGNDRYDGFGIELIQEISKILGFNYTFSLQLDGNYGNIDKVTKEWTGMLREVMDNRADLAITDLTVTADRDSAVDFTMPFMHLGISILYKKPTKQPPSLFSFMSPFSNEVWFYLGTAYLGVSVLTFLLARISPKEWQNPYPCIQEPEQLENQFSMANSLWFTVGSVLQQGSELAPIAISTRMMAGMWWFFTLILVSSYTANLAAFLTVESLSSPIASADDLANQDAIAYGAKKGGATFNFFKDADHPTYRKMYEYMNTHPEAMCASNDEGVERVQTENYAFLMESTSIEFVTERKCDITMVGGLLDEKTYGIAMRKNSTYRSALSEAVLRLQETGTLSSLKRKWWKEKLGGGACAGSEDASSGNVALSVENVGGVFVVLITGCAFGIIVTIFDMLWNVWTISKQEKDEKTSNSELGIANVGGVFFVLICGSFAATFVAFGEMLIGVIRGSRKHKVPFRQELIEELKFIVKSSETKPVRHRRSDSKSPDAGSEHSASNKSRELLKPMHYDLNAHTDDKA